MRQQCVFPREPAPKNGNLWESQDEKATAASSTITGLSEVIGKTCDYQANHTIFRLVPKHRMSANDWP